MTLSDHCRSHHMGIVRYHKLCFAYSKYSTRRTRVKKVREALENSIKGRIELIDSYARVRKRNHTFLDLENLSSCSGFFYTWLENRFDFRFTYVLDIFNDWDRGGNGQWCSCSGGSEQYCELFQTVYLWIWIWSNLRLKEKVHCLHRKTLLNR